MKEIETNKPLLLCSPLPIRMSVPIMWCNLLIWEYKVVLCFVEMIKIMRMAVIYNSSSREGIPRRGDRDKPQWGK